MSFQEWLSFGVVVVVVLVVGAIVAHARLPRSLKRLIYVALGLRIVGSCLRYTILFQVYDGSGDARRYSSRGRDYAERFFELDFSPFYDPSLWVHGRWWGTQFVSFPASLVVSGIGPSLLAEFVVFSLFAFGGLVAFAVAFRRVYADIPVAHYARWIWLFPSLWYWPSSVGKDALVLLGIGLAVAGFAGRRERVDWVLMTAGVVLVFAIRPQVAAVVIASLMLAHWLSFGTRWTKQMAFQGVVILGAGLVGVWLSMNYIGVDGFDVEGVEAYMEAESAGAAGGGSAIENVPVGLVGVPMGVVNILTRPFLWEAHNAPALLSAVEIFAFWMLVWYRRQNVVHALRTWRSHRLLRLAVPFILIYSASLGMLIVNLGIIARQRIFLFPFLFLLLEAAPTPQRKSERATRRAIQSVHPPENRTLAARPGT